MRKLMYILAVFFFTACSLSPNLKVPKADYTSEDSTENNISRLWWREFDDENLNKIIDLALKNNSDLKLAYIRMEQAAAQLGIKFSDLLPKVDGSASGVRAKTSINAPSNQSGDFQYSNDFKMGLNLSYELDIWGKYRDNYLSGRADFRASQYEYEAARLSLLSSAAQMYFNVVNAYENEKALKDAYESANQIYELMLEKFNYGSVGEYELSQAKANAHSIALQYDQAVLNKENNLKALKILVSNDLDDILYQEQEYKEFNDVAIEVPTGITSEIVLQRPDIQASLERLTAQKYLIGVARSAFLPSLSLTGLLGFESVDLDTLVKDGSKTWNIGGSFAMPIFRWGEIYQNLQLAKLSKDSAFINYENTLKTAFGEIRYALIARKNTKTQIDNATNGELSYKRIYEIAKERYEIGQMSLQDYLEARTNWLNAQVTRNNARYAYANSIVNLIKAFGGGFKKSENLSEEIEEDAKNLDFSFRE